MLWRPYILTAALLLTTAGHAQLIPEPTETIMLTSAPPYSATGELFVLRADTNRPALHNPVLVVEGFDIGNSMNWPELYELLNQEALVEDMQAYGRDLLVLNFGDSTVDILANAALSETAIAYINANRGDPADKFTAVGASLGGLTLRKALVDLPAHNVDTWISFDAPHGGANIPLGVQEYLEFFAPHDTSAAELLTALDSPAARQMLLVHHSAPDGLANASLPERLDFDTVLNTNGYPTNCKTIAISNGSGLGEKLPFLPGEKIIHWTDSGFLSPTIEAEVFALSQVLAPVFSGSIYFPFVIDESTTANAYHPLPLDSAPGGMRSTFFQLYTNLTTGADDYCNYTNHCFIPTVSALGIPIDNLESNLAANAVLLALSPFDEIHYALSNEVHVEINTRNKRWIIRAVLEGHDTDGDGYDDYEEHLLGTDYDSPDSTLTVHAVLEVQLANDLAVVSWNGYPNAQFEVWFTGSLGGTWQWLETVEPSDALDITRAYLINSEADVGFFKIIAAPVDPVTD